MASGTGSTRARIPRGVVTPQLPQGIPRSWVVQGTGDLKAVGPVAWEAGESTLGARGGCVLLRLPPAPTQGVGGDEHPQIIHLQPVASRVWCCSFSCSSCTAPWSAGGIRAGGLPITWGDTGWGWGSPSAGMSQ